MISNSFITSSSSLAKERMRSYRFLLGVGFGHAIFQEVDEAY